MVRRKELLDTLVSRECDRHLGNLQGETRVPRRITDVYEALPSLFHLSRVQSKQKVEQRQYYSFEILSLDVHWPYIIDLPSFSLLLRNSRIHHPRVRILFHQETARARIYLKKNKYILELQGR